MDSKESDENAENVEPNTPPKKKSRLNTRRPQKFQDAWLNEADFKNWLKRDPDNSLEGKCCLCNVSFNAEIAVIRNHAKSRAHQAKIGSISKQLSINAFVQAQNVDTSASTSVKRAEIKMAAFMIDHNIPYTVMDHMSSLMKDCFPDSKILEDLQLKSTKTKAIVKNVLGESQKASLSRKLKERKFSIMIDESTDVSAVKSMCIVVRSYDEEEGRIISRFWELCQIFEKESDAESATAEYLFKCITTSFDKYGLSFDNVIGFGSDGCGTMMGANNSVASRFRSLCPGLQVSKCLCHSLHLCASEACKVLPRTSEDLARNIYNFFKASAKRQFAFQKFQCFLDLKVHKMLHPSQTRWLSLETVVSRLLEQWDALKLFFIDKRYSERLVTVEHILNALSDPLMKLFFLFLEYVLPKFTRLNAHFQSDKTVIASMFETVSSAYADFLQMYMDRDYINRTPLHEIQPDNSQKILPLQQMYLGVKVTDFLQKVEIRENANLKENFLKGCNRFLIVSCQQLKKRFDFSNVVLKKISILKPANAVLGKTRKTTPSLLSLMQLLPRIIEEHEYQVVDDEWRQLPNFELPGHINTTDEPDIFWHKLSEFDEQNQVGYTFKNLSKFALNVISLPHSNAECERIFSAVNSAKTKTRNKLVTSSLNGILFTRQRIKNCTTFEPLPEEYARMNENSLYSKAGETRKDSSFQKTLSAGSAAVECESDADDVTIPQRV